MEDSTLLWSSFAASIVGLAVLLVLFNTAGVKDYKISQVKEMDEYEQVNVTARVLRKGGTENVTFLTLQKKEVVEAVVFDDVNVNTGSTVKVIGSVDEYNGEKQVIAEKITVVR